MAPTKRQFVKAATAVLWTCVAIGVLIWLWQAARVLSHPPVKWADLVPSASILMLPLIALMLTIQQRSLRNDPSFDQPLSRERWLLIGVALAAAIGAGAAAFLLVRHT